MIQKHEMIDAIQSILQNIEQLGFYDNFISIYFSTNWKIGFFRCWKKI